MLSTKKALTIITEMNDDKRNPMIDELSEQDAKYLVKILAKAVRESLGDPQKEFWLES